MQACARAAHALDMTHIDVQPAGIRHRSPVSGLSSRRRAASAAQTSTPVAFCGAVAVDLASSGTRRPRSRRYDVSTSAERDPAAIYSVSTPLEPPPPLRTVCLHHTQTSGER